MIESDEWNGAMVFALRRQHDLTQQQLARLLRVRTATVSDWERGMAQPSGAASVALSYLYLDLDGLIPAVKKKRKNKP